MFDLVKRLVVSFVVLTISLSFANCVSSASSPDLSNTLVFVNDGQILQATIAEKKDFTTLGIIFVESSATLDPNGNIIEGSKITFEMLMKEAQKLGADDIINLRIDELQTINGTVGEKIPTGRIGGGGVPIYEEVTTFSRTIVYKANALAIKYLPIR